MRHVFTLAIKNICERLENVPRLPVTLAFHLVGLLDTGFGTYLYLERSSGFQEPYEVHSRPHKQARILTHGESKFPDGDS